MTSKIKRLLGAMIAVTLPVSGVFAGVAICSPQLDIAHIFSNSYGYPFIVFAAILAIIFIFCYTLRRYIKFIHILFFVVFCGTAIYTLNLKDLIHENEIESRTRYYDCKIECNANLKNNLNINSSTCRCGSGCESDQKYSDRIFYQTYLYLLVTTGFGFLSSLAFDILRSNKKIVQNNGGENLE